jgi:diguanylate cyclase (GGDEF)-like protein/PAS domain S-box-containing protein
MNIRQIGLIAVLPLAVTLLLLLNRWHPELLLPVSALLGVVAMGFTMLTTRPPSAKAVVKPAYLDTLRTAVIAVSPTGTILWVNDATCELLEARAEDLLAKQWNELRPEATWREIGQQMAQFTAGEMPAVTGTLMRNSGEFTCISGRISQDPQQLDRLLVEVTDLGAETPGIELNAPSQPEPQSRTGDERFSRIFHSSPDAILIVRDQDRTILDFNAGFTNLLGYSREEAIGVAEPDLELWVHSAERDRILHEFSEEKETDSAETKLRTRDGSIVFAELSLRYIEIDGELCILCIGRDVSQRALAEAALKESQHKFHQVFSRSPDGIAIIRQQDLTICDINEAFIATSGYERDQLLDYSLFELDILNGKQNVLEKTAKLLARDGHFSNIDVTFKTRHGEEIPALVSAALLDVGEEPCILCIAKDVREARATEEQLRVSEERFRGAFENAPIGILLIDMQGQIFQANRFAAELLNYGEESIRNLQFTELLPDEERCMSEELRHQLQSGSTQTVRVEQRMLRADGREIWTNMHAVLQLSRDGKPSYCIVQIADITDTKVSQQRMERMAFYDMLTDLANRRLFHDRLTQVIERSQRSGSLAALLYLDLDQFKRVNDTLGHEAGDALLKEVAQRLTQSVRKDDTVARPGGDEFTILLSAITDPKDANLVAEKILQVLQMPITINDQKLIVTTSIGITIIPTDGTDPNMRMKNADLAMYRAKENGRNNYQFYSEEMNTNAVRRLQTEYELRRALEKEEFVLYYQPKIRLSDLQLVGVECLLRWQHPERGLLAPGEFMDVAEETGPLVERGNWIIDTACQAAKQLAAKNGAPVDTALNISSRQFRDPNLVSTIRDSLQKSGLDPQHLEVEITETMLMHDVDAASETVCQLHDLGVKLAIDDFGTGYSSLSYLKKFPIDTVKVDRSFVMDIPNSSDDMAITSAVIAMAHRLNMQVVAEGVETPEQLEFLLKHHCEYAQGYLFSKAVPLENITRLLAPNVRLLRG